MKLIELFLYYKAISSSVDQQQRTSRSGPLVLLKICLFLTDFSLLEAVESTSVVSALRASSKTATCLVEEVVLIA
eukprot:m.24936 g.24936  ORF g.24936 m.24936 type:complete len:75 (-) comp8660_c1_seq1:2358-2582(-)